MISSIHNDRVKAVARLQRQGRERRRRGLFCLEASRELERALAAGFEVAELYYVPGWLEANTPRHSMIEHGQKQGGFVSEVSDAVLAKMAYRENPQGFVAVLRARTASLTDLATGRQKQAGKTVGGVVCSGLEKPGNVGAILRSAAAAGVGVVMVDRADFDIFNPNCIRASTGAVFSVPIVCADRDSIIAWLHEQQWKIVALSPEADRPYTQVDWQGDWAMVLGAEAEGLDAAWRAAADELVSIPLAEAGGVDSLNVSVAAAVVMFEAKRRGDV
ncbi:MAG: RNA methyltransferase [Phycisphaeraceae bacterium]